MFKKEIEDLIKKTVRVPEAKVFYTENSEFGDYSTNIAFKIKKSAESITPLLQAQFLDKVEVKNGFINFFLKPEAIQAKLYQLNKLIFKKNKTKILIEFISANPTGELHIGHGRSAFYGDVLANILEFAGYKIEREYFINDAKNSNQIKELGKTALGEGTTYLTDYLKTKISRGVSTGYSLAQKIQKDNKKFITQKLKIRFDNWFSEEGLYQKHQVQKTLEILNKKNLTYKKEGAIWLKDWVVIRSNGEPTYFLSDIAYHQDKFKRGYNKIINIWGADHQGHVARLKTAAHILGYKGDLEILISQLVTLKSGKLSKRAGRIITLQQLLDEIGLDATRFFYLMKSLDTQMEFDLDLAKEQSKKNPVYYIQYATVRCQGILRKSKISSAKIFFKNLGEQAELNLMRELIKFPEVIEEISQTYQVHHLSQYALKLADKFHSFYESVQVLTEDKELQQARLSLILVTQKILKQILDLMGISAPKKM